MVAYRQIKAVGSELTPGAHYMVDPFYQSSVPDPDGLPTTRQIRGKPVPYGSGYTKVSLEDLKQHLVVNHVKSEGRV